MQCSDNISIKNSFSDCKNINTKHLLPVFFEKEIVSNLGKSLIKPEYYINNNLKTLLHGRI